jgi:hypothetical protein
LDHRVLLETQELEEQLDLLVLQEELDQRDRKEQEVHRVQLLHSDHKEEQDQQVIQDHRVLLDLLDLSVDKVQQDI